MSAVATQTNRIATLEAELETLYASQARARQDATAAAGASSCAFPPAVDFTNWTGPDVKQPYPQCSPRHQAPLAADLAVLAAQRPQMPAPVLPSLLVPCCAHSGTTFLWRCMMYAFHPATVCGRPSDSPHNPEYAELSTQWTARECAGRRYLLPGLAGNIHGHWDYRKEHFFYGGGAAAWLKGWDDYVGVDLPLCYWEAPFQRALRQRPQDHTFAQARRLCRSREPKEPRQGRRLAPAEGGGRGGRRGRGAARAAPGEPCQHRACLTLDLERVKLGPKFSLQYERERDKKPRWQMQATKSLPRVVPAEHPGAVVPDMTPNYLCSPKALKNLAGSLGAPAHFRMMLLVREPLQVITSSYKMFVEWKWVRSDNLSAEVVTQLGALRKCNRTLYEEPERLEALPGDEVLAYFGKCWQGVWRAFVTNAMPYVCLRAWLAAGFKREQFLLVPSARLRSIRAPALVSKLAQFTGLHYNEAVLLDKREELGAHCEAPETQNREASRRRGGKEAPRKARLVNTHSGFSGDNAQNRTRLGGASFADFQRLAAAHTRLMQQLHLPELDSE